MKSRRCSFHLTASRQAAVTAVRARVKLDFSARRRAAGKKQKQSAGTYAIIDAMASVAGQRISSLPSKASTSRIALTKPRRSAFSTTSRVARQAQLPATAQRPCIVARMPPRPLTPTSTVALRHASSTSSPTSSQTEVPSDILTWDRFFDLRKKRRYLNLGSSVVTAAGAIGIFGPMIAQQDLDGWAAQISGIDPIFVLGLTTFAVAAGGWLCGPSLGNSGFKIWAGRRGWNRGIAEVRRHLEERLG